MIGSSGVTESICKEIGDALDYHELVKVRVNGPDHETRRALVNEVLARSGATLVQSIGHVAVLYRSNSASPVYVPRRSHVEAAQPATGGAGNTTSPAADQPATSGAKKAAPIATV